MFFPTSLVFLMVVTIVQQVISIPYRSKFRDLTIKGRPARDWLDPMPSDPRKYKPPRKPPKPPATPRSLKASILPNAPKALITPKPAPPKTYTGSNKAPTISKRHRRHLRVADIAAQIQSEMEPGAGEITKAQHQGVHDWHRHRHQGHQRHQRHDE